MTDDEFAFEIESPIERRNIEYKGPGSITDKSLVWRITRAILGMTNRQDGGIVIVGVSDSNGALNPVGFDQVAVAEWTRDSLADKVAPLVDPSVEFDLEHRIYNGRYFVLITIREFDETPVFSRSDKSPNGRDLVLREGALYVRGRRKPETIELRTSQEMRDLLDLALTKRLRRFVEQSQAAGISIAGNSPDQRSSTELFRDQLADLGI